MSALLLLPAGSHFAGAVLSLMIRSEPVRKMVTMLMATLALAFSVGLMQAVQTEPLVMHVGNWPAPFGIAFVADQLSGLLMVVFSLLSLLLMPIFLRESALLRAGGRFHFLIHALLVSVYASVVSGDLFNLYVWFELMFVAGFTLMAGGRGHRGVSDSLHYLFANLVTTILLLLAVAWIYGSTGTLNLAHLSQILAEMDAATRSWLYTMMFLALALKVGFFPFLFWLPMGYGSTSPQVSTFTASLLTKVALAVWIRLHTTVFVSVEPWALNIVGAIAALSMGLGVLAATQRYSFREILTTHIVSQLGYILAALSLKTPLGTLAALFYLIKHSMAKSALLIVQSLVYQMTGREDVRSLGGIMKSHRVLGLLFVLSAMGLAGLPPLAGFWAKLLVLKATLEAGDYALMGVAVATGFYTSWSMLKILLEAFLKPHEDLQIKPLHQPLLPYISLFALVAGLLILGLAPGILIEVCDGAVTQIWDVNTYQEAVLKGGH